MLANNQEMFLIGTILITLACAKNLLHAIVSVLKNKITSIVDCLSTCDYEYAQHKIDNECGIGLHCMMSWKESSLLTPQLMQNTYDNLDEINEDEVLKHDTNGNNIEDLIHNNMDDQCTWSS